MINITCYPKNNIYTDMLNNKVFKNDLNIIFVDTIDFSIINNSDILMIVVDESFGYIELLSNIKKHIKIPIITLDNNYDESLVLLSYEYHIYDYIINPYSPIYLLSKIKSIVHNSNLYNVKSNIYIISDNVYLDLIKQDVYINNKRIVLTTKEFQLLKYLIDNKNSVCTRNDIIKNVWEYEDTTDFRTLETHIKTLRRKLGNYEGNVITHRSLGYSFIDFSSNSYIKQY